MKKIKKIILDPSQANFRNNDHLIAVSQHRNHISMDIVETGIEFWAEPAPLANFKAILDKFNVKYSEVK